MRLLIENVINEVNSRKKGIDLKLSKDDKNSIAAMQNAMMEVINMRDSYTRSRERHKYTGLDELLKIVNDWFDFMKIVTAIHIKSARLIANSSENDREFSLEERDQLIKLEEIKKRFTQRLG